MTLAMKAENNDYLLEVHYDSDGESPREWDNLGTMVCSHNSYSLGDTQATNLGAYDNWDDWLQGEVIDEDDEENYVYLPLYLFDHSGLSMNTIGYSCGWDSGQVGWIYARKDYLMKEVGRSEKELFSTDAHREPDVNEHVQIGGIGSDWGKVIEKDGDKLVIDFDYYRVPDKRDPERKVTVTLDDVTEVCARYAERVLIDEVSTYDQYLKGEVYGYHLYTKERCHCCGHDEVTSSDSCWGFYGNTQKELADAIRYNLPAEAQHLVDELETA